MLSPAAAQPAPEPEAPEAADSEDTDAANEARRARVYARVGQVVISVGDIEDVACSATECAQYFRRKGAMRRYLKLQATDAIMV